MPDEPERREQRARADRNHTRSKQASPGDASQMTPAHTGETPSGQPVTDTASDKRRGHGCDQGRR